MAGVDCVARGETIAIFECGPPWHPNLGPDWTRHPVAQLNEIEEDPTGIIWG